MGGYAGLALPKNVQVCVRGLLDRLLLWARAARNARGHGKVDTHYDESGRWLDEQIK